jgi:2-polyprenyl-3-methyl-5-hydroxy-6-metoxy-1,4-benzoquinol methylase
MNKCPICKGDQISAVDKIEQSTLLDYYRKSLEIDASSALKVGGATIQLLHCRNCDLKWYTPSISGDPAFYEGLQKHTWYYQDEKPEYYYACKFIKSNDKLCEIGCGKGAFAKFLPPDVTYRGLEFNEEAANKGRLAGLKINTESLDVHVEQNVASYDVVCLFQVLEHVADPLSFLESCAGLLKPGGLLVVAVPAEDSFLSITEGGYLNMPPHHLTRWTDKALGFAIGRVGFEPIEYWHEPVASYHLAWYRSALGMFALRNLTGQIFRLHTSDFFSRLLRRLLRVKFFGDILSAYGANHFIWRGRGHTVCVVGKKTGCVK